ncbi:unnamed protein product [Effrenium voratum]|nr:unnamed protein product [Effrenium voratum]
MFTGGTIWILTRGHWGHQRILDGSPSPEDMGTGSLGLQCMPSPIRPRLSKRPEDRDREVVVKAPDRVNSKLKNRQQLHLNSYEFRGDMEVSKVKALLPSPRKLEGLQLPSVPVHTNNSPRSPSDGSSDESSPQMSPLVSRQATEDKVEKVTSRNLPMVSVQEVELLQESEEGISSTSPMRRRPSDPAPRVPVESWQSRMKNVLTARRSSNFAARDLKRLRRPSAS